eukprot:TRINITY_DN1747_c0_g1_i1.p1 TRINITY_DN1747_c0_g1~~TRINITY_DN1747_c0_g1_i1.p1  ORF type:complete len:384 (-),score=92.27 TRINITY_DN1747_c0_g1_i1:80-1123(-)
MSITKEGFLLKQGSMNETNWNKRYFILQSNLLLRFDKKPTSSSNPGQAKSATNILGCTIFPSFKTGHQFCIDIVDSAGRKASVLSCSSPEDQKEWIEVLSAASKPVASVSFPGLTVTPSVQRGPAVEIRQYSAAEPKAAPAVIYQGSPYYQAPQQPQQQMYKQPTSAYPQPPTQSYQPYQSSYPAQPYQAQANYPPPPTIAPATSMPGYPTSYPTGAQYPTQPYQPQYTTPTQSYQQPKPASSYSSAFPVFGGAYTDPVTTSSSTAQTSVTGPTPVFQPTQPYNPSSNNNNTPSASLPVNPFTEPTPKATAPAPQRTASQNPFVEGSSTNPFDQATPNTQYPYLYST